MLVSGIGNLFFPAFSRRMDIAELQQYLKSKSEAAYEKKEGLSTLRRL